MKIYQDLLYKIKSISVTGLGYVGLPLALELGRHFRVIGFDINQERINMMKKGLDPSKELDSSFFNDSDIHFTSDPEDLKNAHFHIIGVPTDIDDHKVPDLKPLLNASKSIGQALKHGDYVVYESTVYPGCTEEDCLPVLEKYSGLKGGIDFKFGYSPERINPGDKKRTLTKILKIVSGCDLMALKEISLLYGYIIKAGIYEASSIKVAEAAKVIENIQRDINISLVNELAIIFDKLNIDTKEVIDAAGTKWNFHKYLPGLVGGHCISVDPFYMLHKAKELGHDPQVISAGRRVNDYIPQFISKKIVQTLIDKGNNPGNSNVLVLGVTFKENVADIRNSKVFDLIKELKSYSLSVDVMDPYASPQDVLKFGIKLKDNISGKYDAIVISVGHFEYRNLEISKLKEISKKELLLFDVKGIYKANNLKGVNYWSL